MSDFELVPVDSVEQEEKDDFELVPLGDPTENDALPKRDLNDYEVPSIQKQIIESGSLDQAMRVSRGDLEWSLKITQGVDPEVSSRVKKISEAIKMPKDTVHRNLGTAEELKRAQEVIEGLTEKDENGDEKFPYTIAWLSNPEKMALAKDDVEALSQMENEIKSQGPWYSRMAHEFVEGSKDLARGGLGNLEAIQSFTANIAAEEEKTGELSFWRGISALDALITLQRQETPEERKSNLAAMEQQRKFGPLAPENLTRAEGFEQYVYDFSRMIPQVIGAIGSTAALGPIAGAGFVGSYIFGSSYTELKDQGATPERAAKAAFGNAAVQTALEYVQIGAMLKLFKATGAKQVVTQFISTLITEVGAEALQSFPEEASRIWGMAEKEGQTLEQQVDIFVERLPETARQGLYEGLVVAPLAIFGATGAFVNDYAAIRQADKDRAHFEKLEEIIAESKLNGRDPELVKEFLGFALDGNKEAAKTATFPVGALETYFQDDPKGFDDTIKELGVEAQVEEARTTGTEIEVNVDNLLTKYAKTEMLQALKPDLRFFDGMTENEASNLKKNLTETINKQQQDYKELKAENVVPEQLLAIREKLIKEQGMSAEEADHNLALAMAGIEVFAKKRGETISDAVARINFQLKVGEEYVQSDEAVKQKEPFDKAKVSPETFDEVANGLLGDIERADSSPVSTVNEKGEPVKLNAQASTFPKWYKKLGAKNKQAAINAIKNKKGVVYERFKDEVYNAVEAGREGKEYFQTDRSFQPTEYINTDRVKELGFTEDFKEAGYITPEGNLIDLSGKNEGGTPGMRSLDHREVGGTNGMLEFMNLGNIRIASVFGSLDVMREPTGAQEEAIKEWVLENNSREILITLQDGLGKYNEFNGVYDGTSRDTEISFQEGVNPKSVIRRLREYYNGKDFTHGDVFFQNDPLGFYSQLQKTVEGFDFKAMPAKDLLNRIKKTPGLKAEEIEWTGIEEFLNAKEGKVSKEEIVNFLQQGGVQLEEVVKESEGSLGLEEDYQIIPTESGIYSVQDWAGNEIETFRTEEEAQDFLLEGTSEDKTKYGQYVVKGGENYREVLLRMPEKKVEYKSSHWEETNILAHMRLNDRVDSEGKKTLFVEEIQSDWHQEGRKEGYGVGKGFGVNFNGAETHIDPGLQGLNLKEVYASMDEAKQVVNKIRNRLNEKGVKGNITIVKKEEGVPNAPFKNSEAWAMLAFKRVLRMAAEQGYDSVSWTPGEVQAERYDLSKQIDSIEYIKHEDGKYYITIMKDGGDVTDQITGLPNGLEENQLEEYVGKEVAQKIINGEGKPTEENADYKELSGVDLKVGGEGMKGFYDKLLPKAVGKYIKKLDKSAKVGVDKIIEPKKDFSGDYRLNFDLKNDYTIEDFRKIDRGGKRVDYELYRESDKFEIIEEVLEGEKVFGAYVNGELLLNFEEMQSALDSINEVVTKQIDSLKQQAERVKKQHESMEAERLKGQDVWHLPLTDKIKEKVLAGQSLFQDKKKDPKGSVTFTETATIINLYKTADYSTFLHETGHIFQNEMKNLIDDGFADEQTIKDYETIINEYGEGREGSEKFARAFESYLREGKAPSVKLAKAFSKFRAWLTAIYKRVSGLNVEINDDIREVFDRLLASENEIAQAKEYYKSKKSLIDLIPTNQKQKAKLIRTKEEADAEALSRQTKTFLKAYWAAKRGGKAATKEYAKNEIENLPVYKAMAEAKSDKTSIEELALKYEFESPEALNEAINNAPKKQDAIKDRYKELIEAEEKVIIDELQKEQTTPGDDAVHSEKQLAYLIAEAEVMAEKIQKEEVRAERRLEAQVFKDAASEAIGKKKVSEAVSYKRYARAEQRYAKEVYTAMEKGDLVAAHKAKKMQILNHAMVLEAINARETKTKIENRYKTTAIKKRVKNTENDFAEVTLDLIQFYKLSSTDTVGPQNAKTIKSLEQLDEVLAGLTPEWIMQKQMPEGAKSYKDLTMNQLIELDETIQSIIHYGRDELKSIQDEQYKTVSELANASVEQMSNLKDKHVYDEFSLKKKPLALLDGLLAYTKRLEFIAERLDNYSFEKSKVFGPIRRLVVRGVKAEADFNGIREGIMEKSKPFVQTLYKATKRLEKKYGKKSFQIDDVPVTPEMKAVGRNGWTGERIISFVLNLGNEGNFKAIEASYGYSQQQMAKLVSQLTTEELNAIQSIWDITDTLFAPLNQTHFNIYNRYIKKVDAKSLMVKSAEGEIFMLKGGYYPLMFDHALNDKAEMQKEEKTAKENDIMQNRNNNIFRKTKPEDGPTHERTGGKLPPKLSFDVWFSHINDVARYVSHAEYLRDFNRVSLNPEWREAVRKKGGDQIYRMVRDSISYQALPERVRPDGDWDKILDSLRSKATLAILGLNIPVGIKQKVSMINAAEEIGWKYIAKGLMVTDIKNSVLGLTNSEKYKKMLELSDYMRTRAGKISRDIADAVNRLSPMVKRFEIAGKDFTWKDVQDFAFEWIQMNDRATVGVVWFGALHKSLDENMNLKEDERIKKAVEYADAIARTTQPSSLPIDMSKAQRIEGAMRLFTSFSTFTMGVYGNRLQYKYRAWRDGAITNKQYFRHIMMDTVLPSYALATIGSLFSFGDLPEEDELLTAPIETSISWMPVVRDFASVKYGRSIGESPTFEGFNRAVKAFKSSKKAAEKGRDKDYYRALWDLGRAAELVIGVPALNVVKQIDRTHKNITGQNKRKK